MCSSVELRALEKEYADTLLYRRASHITDALMLEFSIAAEARDQISVLADPLCRNNRDALCSWSMEQLEEQDEFLPGNELSFLRQRLTQRMHDYEVDFLPQQKIEVGHATRKVAAQYRINTFAHRHSFDVHQTISLLSLRGAHS